MWVFLEKYVLPLLSAIFITIFISNIFKLRVVARVIFGVPVIVGAFWISHLIQNHSEQITNKALTPPSTTGSINANGNGIVANTGPSSHIEANINVSDSSSKKPEHK